MGDKQQSEQVSDLAEESLDKTADSSATIKDNESANSANGESAASENAQDGEEIQDANDDPVVALNEQLSEVKDQVLRAAAEMQNLRKRSERDVENAHKFGQEKLISSLLPVLDNLDRAIDSIEKEAANCEDQQADLFKSLIEGVELTRKSALDALQKFSVDVLEPYGEPFDPQFHEAMTMVPSETAEPNSVIDVLQKGYSLHGRLLRAAMVVVAKAE